MWNRLSRFQLFPLTVEGRPDEFFTQPKSCQAHPAELHFAAFCSGVCCWSINLPHQVSLWIFGDLWRGKCCWSNLAEHAWQENHSGSFHFGSECHQVSTHLIQSRCRINASPEAGSISFRRYKLQLSAGCNLFSGGRPDRWCLKRCHKSEQQSMEMDSDTFSFSIFAIHSRLSITQTRQPQATTTLERTR